MSIGTINFGRLEAESDRLLTAYFVDTGVVDRLKTGQRYLVVGRKGSGKTALFSHISPANLGVFLEKLDFEDYSWEAHKAFREEGGFAESAYQGSWRFTFLMAMVDHFAKNGTADVRGRAAAIRAKLYGKEDPTWKEVLFDKMRRVRRLDLPSAGEAGGLGGFELEEGSGVLFPSSISRWSKQLLDFISEHYVKYPITLFLDRLDDAWDASDASKGLLIGAIKAAREINLAFGRHGRPAPIVLFLRTDIWDLLLFNDKMKMSQDIEYLDWNEDSLCSVIEARIATSLNIPREGAWDRAFSSDGMRQRASIRSYLVKRTMLRPRDMIRFAICCQNEAVKHGHNVIETDDVYEGENQYSSDTYGELIDEMHKQIPEASEYMQILKAVEKQRFKLDDWMAGFMARFPVRTDRDAVDALGLLFDYAIVGIPKSGGRAGGTVFQFKYEDRLLKPNFNAEMVVHSGLKKALSLKDRGA